MAGRGGRRMADGAPAAQKPLPNHPFEGGGDDATPALSESPSNPKGLVAEAEMEIYADAVVSDTGGAASASEALRQAQPDVLPKKKFGPVFWVSIVWVLGIIVLAILADFL